MIDRLKSCIDYLVSSRKIFNASDLAKILGKQRSYISEILMASARLANNLFTLFVIIFPNCPQIGL